MAAPAESRAGSSTTDPSREMLAGLIERVTVHSPANGFCVLRIKARGHRDLVTVVGHAAEINPGEWITVSGEWVTDREHGLQFKASFLCTSPPTSAEGMAKYLGSGMIRGIGPIYASKLIDAFGEEVFAVIEESPEVICSLIICSSYAASPANVSIDGPCLWACRKLRLRHCG